MYSSTSFGMSSRMRAEPSAEPRIFFSRKNSLPSTATFVPGAYRTEDRDRTARLQHAEALLERGGQADAFEGEFDAALCQFHDLGDNVAVARQHDVGRAEPARELELGGHRVDGDDARGAGDQRPVDGGQPDAPAANDGHRRACRHLRVSEHRTGPGNYGASEQRGAVERHVISDLDQCVAVHQQLFGEAGQVEDLAHRPASEREPLRLTGRLLDVGVGAQCEAAAEALPADAAEHAKRADDAVAAFRSFTRGPTDSTTPDTSCPRTPGSGNLRMPSM
jgi:hypothetical protein